MNETKQSLSIPIAILLAGAMVAFGVYMTGRKPAAAPAASDALSSQSVTIRELVPEDYVLGSRKAPILLIGYSDIECPFCKIFHETMTELMKEYGASGKLGWAFRHYPVHTNSVKEAEAAECAGELGGNDYFWKYVNRAFELTDSNNGLDLELLGSIAKELGLDEQKFDACLESGKFTQKINRDFKEATDSGALGTPYSVIFAKGERIPIDEAYPYNEMKTLIDAILQEL